MKRSGNITLAVMGTLAFTASFAGGSAFLAWRNPASSQSCTTATDGAQTCVTSRSSGGFARYFYSPFFSGRGVSAASPSANTSSRLVSGPPGAVGAGMTQGTSRGGFGAIARAAFHGSAAS